MQVIALAPAFLSSSIARLSAGNAVAERAIPPRASWHVEGQTFDVWLVKWQASGTFQAGLASLSGVVLATSPAWLESGLLGVSFPPKM
jgi:hypothetical protein